MIGPVITVCGASTILHQHLTFNTPLPTTSFVKRGPNLYIIRNWYLFFIGFNNSQRAGEKFVFCTLENRNECKVTILAMLEMSYGKKYVLVNHWDHSNLTTELRGLPWIELFLLFSNYCFLGTNLEFSVNKIKECKTRIVIRREKCKALQNVPKVLKFFGTAVKRRTVK